MENVTKLSLSATVIVASVILGGFYYMGEVSKQKSIEKQQEVKIAEEKRRAELIETQQAKDKQERALCSDYAEDNAIALNKDSCSKGEYCIKGDGMYLVAQYENSYKSCLKGKGLE